MSGGVIVCVACSAVLWSDAAPVTGMVVISRLPDDRVQVTVDGRRDTHLRTPGAAVTDTARLWKSVDALTLPTSRRLTRDDAAVAVADAVTDLHQQNHTRKVVPAVLARYSRMTTGHGTVPSLWDQADQALTTGGEQQEGHSKQVHRTPCDLELMEVRADIADSVEFNIVNREPGRLPTGDVKAQIRHLASLVTANPDHIELWTYKFEQWARLLTTKLAEVVTQNRPRALRDTRCPNCHADHAIIEEVTGERLRTPPLVIDFNNGLVRGAECLACGHYTPRGDLPDLADAIREACG